MRTLFLAASVLAMAACQQETSSAPADEAVVAPGSSVYDAATVDMTIVDWVNAELAAGNEIGFANPVDALGAEFVQVALRMGRVDSSYVDAYHGPSDWQVAADAAEVTRESLDAEIAALQAEIAAMSMVAGSPEAVRVANISKLLRAMAVRLAVVSGDQVTFDEEVSQIYDVVPPVYDMAEFDAVLVEIDALLPGDGSLSERVDAFRNELAIPKDKLQQVFERATAECRVRTAEYFDLPDNESFNMEFVSDKPWSGYNWYQGGYNSLIQINTDFPIIIDRAVDLGCHEGYPGHHVWNFFIEKELVQERGWIEYSVNPLFGPFGPVAEGTANYGIELAFPGDEKIKFERDVLFPMAGLDPAKADELEALKKLTGKLSHATNEIARRYLDGDLTAEEAIPLIQKYSLSSAERAAQRIRFVDTYRGYVINYNMGLDLARSYVEAAGEDPEARWAAFKDVLTAPMTPSDIVAKLEAE